MERYRKMLLIAKSEIEARILSTYNEHINITDSIEETEQIQDRNSKEILAKMLEKDSLKLRHIVAALKKIAANDYGECKNCGCEISEKRLLALPLAQYCIDCQEDFDKKSR